MYADLLDDEGINSQYLVVIKPRRFLEQGLWTFISGTKYSQEFLFGQIIQIQNNDAVEVQASSATLSDGTWFFDEDSSVLYVDFGSDPGLSYVVGTYEVYFGTFDAQFNRVPTDPTTRVVYFEPLIIRSPEVQASNTDLLFGFLPSLSTSITISNVTQYLQSHLYDSSFNRCEIAVYHYLDELVTENVKLITKGICGSVTTTDLEVSIIIFDNNDLFNAEYRHVGLTSFFALSDFLELDPNFQARAIRRVYGVVDGFIPVNIDYKLNSPANTDNRTWVCLKPHTDLADVSTTPLASPLSTTTRTYLTSAHGIRVGDSVWIDSILGPGSDGYVMVTLVNKTGSHYIEHAAIGVAATSADTVKRSFVGAVQIYKEGVSYTALYGKHYTNFTDAVNSVAGFTFATTLEADLSIATLSPQDLVSARVYGNKNTVILDGLPFGSDSLTTKNLTDPTVIFFDLLKNALGVSEDSINLTSFEAEWSAISDEVGFAIPSQAGSNFPTFKELFTSLAQTLLLKVFLDDDSKFAITQTAPQGPSTKTIEDDEVLLDSFSYSFDYRDIRSDIFVQFAAKEVSLRNLTGSLYYALVNSVNNVAKRLHQIQKQETFTSLHFLESDAQKLSDRLSYALGERRGLVTFQTKTRFFNSQINDVIKISRTKLPGFPYSPTSLNDLNAVVVSLGKSLSEISLSLDDQKGIEDNFLNW